MRSGQRECNIQTAGAQDSTAVASASWTPGRCGGSALPHLGVQVRGPGGRAGDTTLSARLSHRVPQSLLP